MTYTTILWDLDGTIVDSGPGVFASFKHTIAAMKLPALTDAQLRPLVGPPLRDSFTQILGMTPDQVEEAIAIYRDFYHADGVLNAALYPGVIDVIRNVREAGKTNSLATSKALAGATIVGEHFGFLELMDFLGTADFAANRSQKTEVVEYALAGLAKQGADLSRVLLVGDRIHDINGARNTGIDVALVKWGFGSPDEWALADHVVDSAEDLARLVL